MRTGNPLRSEDAAFRLLLLVVVYLAIVVAAVLLGGPWVGLAVFVVVTAVALWWLVRGDPPEQRL